MQIRHKKRKQKGWDLDKDDGNCNNDYPAARNELGNMMREAEDEDSGSESSIG
jgi:hypothetical protein